jgi:hypothetical protein
MCGIVGSGFIVVDESEELGDACCVGDVLRVRAGELPCNLLVSYRKVSC